MMRYRAYEPYGVPENLGPTPGLHEADGPLLTAWTWPRRPLEDPGARALTHVRERWAFMSPAEIVADLRTQARYLGN